MTFRKEKQAAACWIQAAEKAIFPIWLFQAIVLSDKFLKQLIKRIFSLIWLTWLAWEKDTDCIFLWNFQFIFK